MSSFLYPKDLSDALPDSVRARITPLLVQGLQKIRGPGTFTTEQSQLLLTMEMLAALYALQAQLQTITDFVFSLEGSKTLGRKV